MSPFRSERRGALFRCHLASASQPVPRRRRARSDEQLDDGAEAEIRGKAVKSEGL